MKHFSPLLALALLSTTARAEVTPSHLRCEYRVDPVGIDQTAPRLSWIVESTQRAQRQTAYQILAASSPDNLKAGRGDVWDSGRVASDATAQIAFAGKPLQTAQQVWWQVRCWDKDGKASAYSAPARWAMGLLDPAAEWKGQWIGKEALPGSQGAGAVGFKGLSWVWFPEGDPTQEAPGGTRYFRKVVNLAADRPLKSARFQLTADDQFTLWVNGQEACKSDGQTDAWKRPVTCDLKALLKTGPNVLAIAATNEAHATGLLGRLALVFETGDPLMVPIDAAWKTSQTAPEGWQTAAFDDAAWPAAKAIAPFGGGPWGDQVGTGGKAAPPPAVFLRKTFEVKKPLRRATAYATALGLYELHLNGHRVGDDVFTPGWTDYKKRVYYQTYDVTPLLKTGANAVGAILGDGWATGHDGNGGRDRYGLHRPRFSGQIVLDYADGTREVVGADASWKASYGPIVEQDLLDGEFYDATQEMPGWDTADFPRVEVAPVNVPAAMARAGAWGPVDIIATPPLKIEAYPGVPVRRQLELHPKTVTEPQSGSYVFDLGQNMVGWARLNNITAPRGTKIRVRVAEMLNPNGTIYVTNLRGARCIDEYTCKGGGPETWEPRFTFHGFRYVELTGLPAKPDTQTVTGVVVHSQTPFVGTFECSNAQVNQLQSNIQWGQRGNFLEVPTDCPQRDERCGWMGDAQIFVRTATYNADVASFFNKWMVDVQDAQRGAAFADISPDICCGAGTPAWADAGVIVPWTIYLAYGDTRILEEHYDAMARYIEWIKGNNPDLLWNKNRGSDYGDWLSIAANTPKDVIGTAYFAYSTSLMARIARALGKAGDAQKYDDLFAQIKAAFNKEYVAPDGRIKGDTQTCYVLALRFDLLPADKRTVAAQYLVDDIKKKNDHLSTGFVGVGYLNPVLTQTGHTDVAYKLLLQDTFPSWGYSIKYGATTIWERWDGWTAEKGFQNPGMNSFNHYSLGSVGEWMFDTVAGIGADPERPGFKGIVIHPRPGGGMTFAHATYDSLRGPIASEWRLDGGALALKTTIPANATATIYVPAAPGAKITESGQPADKAPGLKWLRQDGEFAVFEAGSGSYSFVVK